MKRFFLLIFFICAIAHLKAQVTVYKKIAQRRDDYVANTWKGKDSFLFTYNNDTFQTSITALQCNANNVWDNWYRYTYTINAFGKVATQLRENWSAGNWVNNTLYTYTYDVDSNNTEILYSVWNGGTWNPTGKIEYTNFNLYGKYQNEFVSVMSGGAWTYQTWKKFTYVNNQTLKEDEEKYNWSIPASNWEKWEKYFYTYTQNEIGTITRYLPDTAAVWVPKDKYLYNYNLVPFHILEYVAQKYDSINLTWKNISRLTYNYTANNLLDKTQNEIYANNVWNPTNRAQYLYNANDEKIEYFTELFNLGNWDKNTRSTYAYNNSLLSEENQFVGVANAWQQNTRLSYSYDVNQNKIYEKNESCSGGAFTPLSQTFYYYNAFTVDVHDKIKEFSKLFLFPNPASQVLNLQFVAEKSTQIQVNILDIYGKTNLIISQPVFAHQNLLQIPCSSLSEGFYFAQIIDLQSGHQQVEKFQVLK